MKISLIDKSAQRGYRLMVVVLIFGTSLFLSACRRQTTEISRVDDTAPEVWMEVFGLGEIILLEVDGDPAERTIIDPFKMVTAMTTVIDEDGGVSFSGVRFEEYCGDIHVGSANAYRQTELEPEDDFRLAPTSLLNNWHFSFATYPRFCDDQARNRGFEYDSITLRVWGIGANFNGEQTNTAVFTLILQIPDVLSIDPSVIMPESEYPLPHPDFSLLAIVRIATLCWFGPGAEFGTVSSLAEGIEVPVIGVGELPGWWIIDNPRFPGVACWVEEDDLEIDPTLDLSALPEYQAPPLNALEENGGGGGALKAPSNLKAATTCASPTYNVKLTWNDNSNNENGFRIYRDGALVGMVGADITQFTDNNPTNSNGHTYTVRAYNAAGESSAVAVSSVGCIF